MGTTRRIELDHEEHRNCKLVCVRFEVQSEQSSTGTVYTPPRWESDTPDINFQPQPTLKDAISKIDEILGTEGIDKQ